MKDHLPRLAGCVAIAIVMASLVVFCPPLAAGVGGYFAARVLLGPAIGKAS